MLLKSSSLRLLCLDERERGRERVRERGRKSERERGKREKKEKER